MASGERAIPRVFLDSSCLTAGAFSRSGASHSLLQLAALGLLDARISPDVWVELERNTLWRLSSALPALRVLLGETVTEAPSATEADLAAVSGMADAKDVPILASAVAQGCDYLLTLNEGDFWPPPETIRVMRPGPFLANLGDVLSRVVAAEA